MLMRTFVIIACIVIVLLHAVIVCIRCRRNKQPKKKSGKAIVWLLSAPAFLGVIVMNLPSLKERMALWIAPKMIALGAASFLFLLTFLVATSLVRMLIEQFVLHVPYKKFDWFQIILFNAAVAVFLIVHFIKYR